MTRPAIVIGLGGTGQEVLTFLKKELLEIGGGQMPPEVKLLAFDTASRIPPKGGQAKDTVFRLGNVALDEGTEYICIGADLYPLAEEIRQGRHPHLQWFPAKAYHEKNLSRAAYNTVQGAGAVRQMGRLSLFNAVPTVLAHLRQAILNLQDKVTGQIGSQDLRLLEILVVGSFAGGTGAGTLIDMAWLVRLQADALVRQRYVLRGFFVLPSAFGTGAAGEGRDKMARAFAVWRELDRAMISKTGSGGIIVYNPYDRNLWVKCDKPAYDVTYLIDPQRDDRPILPPPEEGIFPAIAHIMSFILDERAGVAYTEHLINTIASTRSQIPRGVYHSAIGSFTLKVPVYYAQAKFSHQLARDILKELLAPEFNDKGRVIRVSQLANREVPQGTAGLQAAIGFLSASALNFGGKNIPNTKLMQLIGDIRARNAQENGKYIASIAQGGLTTTLLPFFNALNQITEYDPEKNQIITHDLTDELKWHIWNEVPPSRVVGDTPEQAWARITSPAMQNSVPSVRARRYGTEAVTNQDYRLRGTFGKELEKSKAAQMQRFRELLQAQTLHDLNGDHPDARIARGGKIGYVLAFYNELADALEYFIGFLNKVRVQRNQVEQIARKTRSAADAALKVYQSEMSKKCWFTFWDDFVHPDAHRAQRAYLEAEQRDIDVRRGDILLDVLAETAAEMKAYVERTRDELQNWIAHLATGDPNFEITSLYSLVQESLDNIEVNHALDRRLGNPNFQQEKQLRKVSQVIGEHEYQSDVQMITEALERIHWHVEQGRNGLQLSCGIEFPGDTPESRSTFEPFRREGEKPAQYNLRLLLRLSERPFQALKRDHPIAREIAQVYPTGEELAEALHKNAEPFYAKTSVSIRPMVKKAYMRVDYELDARTTDYFGMGFVPRFQKLNPELGTQGLNLVSSQDRYKITLVRSDDLLPSQSFAQWEACREQYRIHINDPMFGTPAEELYVFPAEIHAASYEARMPRLLGQNWRQIQPEVVAFLEDRERFALFFLAFAHGFIRRENAEGGGTFWVYQLPEHKEPIYLTLPPRGLEQTKEDIFELLSAFLSGHDQRPGLEEVKTINWKEALDAVLKKERELGRRASVARYSEQKDENKDGIVKAILSQAETIQAEMPQPPSQQIEGQDDALKSLSQIQRQKYYDLADLAKVIYEDAIQRCNNTLQDKPEAR